MNYEYYKLKRPYASMYQLELSTWYMEIQVHPFFAIAGSFPQQSIERLLNWNGKMMKQLNM